jgi:hypothetical protein
LLLQFHEKPVESQKYLYILILVSFAEDFTHDHLAGTITIFSSPSTNVDFGFSGPVWPLLVGIANNNNIQPTTLQEKSWRYQKLEII